MAVWMNNEPYKYSDMIFDCELRVNSRNSAFLVVCGSKEEDNSLEDFMNKVMSFAPSYDEEKGLLSISENEYLQYNKGNDKTQYVI
jgi:hypothetical protein